MNVQANPQPTPQPVRKPGVPAPQKPATFKDWAAI